MLRIGQARVRTCSGWSRRELLRAGTWAALGIPWLNLQGTQTLAETTSGAGRSLILLWLWGGPSHLDLFDMKPAAPLEYRGPYRPISTRVPGIQISELLPQLAARADRLAILRSLHHESNDHGIAGTISLTGGSAGAVSLGGQTLPGRRAPTHGSVVARVLGFAPGMPRFATVGGLLHQGKKRIAGEDGGSLGGLYDPFRLDYHPGKGVEVPQLKLVDGVSPSGLESRDALRAALNQLTARWETLAATRQMNRYYEQAAGLLTSAQAREVFDLDREPEKRRARYGRHRFGQCCLLARRLVEAGVRCVQVNWSSHVEPIEDTGDGGWDMHDRNFRQLQDRHAWMLDQAASALLDDLEERGLLGQTAVVMLGEFGRTPKINEKAGRDHWNQCYSGLVAGAGMPTGQVIGASDARGEFPIDQPCTPADLFATVLHRLGIGTPQLTSVGIQPQGQLIESLL